MSAKRKSILLTAICVVIHLSSAGAARLVLEKPLFRFPEKGPIQAALNGTTGDYTLRWKNPDGSLARTTFSPATKIDVIVTGAVDFDMTADEFIYQYRLESLRSSRQHIQWLIVEFNDAIQGISSPESWNPAGLSFESALSWVDTTRDKQGKVGLAPGSVLDGFGFKAPGSSGVERFSESPASSQGFFFHRATSPGIVRCWARGHTDVVKVSGEAPEGLTDMLPRLLDDSVRGFTGGPVPIPKPLDPAKFAATIGDYSARALSLGWIDDPVTEKRLQEAISKIREALLAKNYALASRLLGSLKQGVDQEPTKGHLTSEAIALIKLNSQYLEREVYRLSRQAVRGKGQN